MTLLYYDPVFLEHDTGRHPECAARLAAVHRRLEESGLADRCQSPSFGPVVEENVLRVHELSYLDDLRRAVERGGGRIEVDTVVCPRSLDVALRAAGAVCDAVERVVKGPQREALCLVRPPGHHALRGEPMGFCLLNNIAVGASLATRRLGLDRVLIVDWDVHHGNGTQDTFWADPQVGFLSLHRWPFYPGTGRADETGSGPGLGTNCNVPLPMGTPRRDYLAAFRQSLEDMAARMRPELVLISAGFDAHRTDPIGSLGLEVEDFAELTRAVIEIADSYAGGRIVSTLEGGYDPEILAQCVAVHLETLLAH